MYKTVDAFMETVISKNSGQDEFHQAVHEVVESIWDAASSSGFLRRAHIDMSHPSAANIDAIARPIPSLPPVMAATLPCNPKSIEVFLFRLKARVYLC